MKIIWAVVLCFTCTLCFAVPQQPPNTIVVYDDDGVSQESLTQTLHALRQIVSPTINIKTINAKQVRRHQWQKTTILFVMPGGADVPYQKKLHGIGNRNIRDYVEHGGAYLGLCAGGYYACNKVIFAPGTQLAVVGKRELALYIGTAYGPAYNDFDYGSHQGAHAAKIEWGSSTAKPIRVYYHGGAYFDDRVRPYAAKVLARYHDRTGQPPAIVMTDRGAGKVILSGVHPEYDYRLLDANNPQLATLIPRLKEYDADRLQLLKYLMRKLNVRLLS